MEIIANCRIKRTKFVHFQQNNEWIFDNRFASHWLAAAKMDKKLFV